MDSEPVDTCMDMSVGLPEQSGEEKGLRTERPAAHKTGPKDRGLSVSIRALYIDLAVSSD